MQRNVSGRGTALLLETACSIQKSRNFLCRNRAGFKHKKREELMSKYLSTHKLKFKLILEINSLFIHFATTKCYKHKLADCTSLYPQSCSITEFLSLHRSLGGLFFNVVRLKHKIALVLTL